MADNVDPTLCSNPDPDALGECCGDSFDHKDSPGLCARCYIVTKDPKRAEIVKDWPQCTGCNQQSALPPRNLVVQDPDGQLPLDITSKTLQEHQADARQNAMLACTLHKCAQKPATTGSGSPQTGIARGPRQISVYLVPIASTGMRTEASRILANATRSFPEDMLMTDVMVQLLHHWNLDWEKEGSESLTPDHVSLRLLGNVGIQPHSTLGTLGQFFDAQDRIHGNHPKKILQGPTTLRLPPPAVYLEGLISVQDFENDTGVQAPYFVHTERENRKHKPSQSNRVLASDLGSGKRSQSQSSGPVPLRSEFGAFPGFSKIPFLFASVSVAPDGTVKINWPDLTDAKNAPSICLLQDVAFDQGETKMVHKVIYGGLPWVAKRFFNIGTGEGLVEICENYCEIMNEGTRLARGGISVTDFKLGVELISSDSGPSIASGFSMEQHKIARDGQVDTPNSIQGSVIWLFEPRRSSKVERWSGTNDYPPWHQNKLGSTMNTFTHFVYLFSQESTVPADLQTSTVVQESGDAVQILFDIMTHTLDGSSGVGDHGQAGILAFLAKHQCRKRCSNLRLNCDGFEFNSERGSENSDIE
ncbi:kinase-like domain-containing protein [Mycena sanguinolenta]|nr:kinase-like domain-containing protein [Mycena sanguinolenta]